jgi:hypothetical protein
MKKPLDSGGAVSFKEKISLISDNNKDTFFPIEQSDYLEKFKVSLFETVKDKSPFTISLLSLCKAIKNCILNLEVNQIRRVEVKSEKDKLKVQLLPAVTTSGIFENGHSESNLSEHSGLMQIDFDNLENIEFAQDLLCKDEYTFIGFVSPSGNGYKLIVKIPPEFHKEIFPDIFDYYLRKYNLKIDEKCKDISRLMFIGADKNIFININSKTFKMNFKNQEKIEKIILEIETKKIDITVGYKNWLDIGFAIASEFKEFGRKYFHSISKQNTEYDFQKCEKQYTECLKDRRHGITIATFYYLAKQNGITWITTELQNNVKNDIQKLVKSKIDIIKNYILGKYELRYNEVSNEIEIKENGEKEFKILNDNNLYVELLSNNHSVSQANFNALLRSNFIPSYDPLKEYFESLPEWDYETDYIANLCKYIKVKEQERFEIQFKKMLVRCIACSIGGTFNKHAFIFIGGQSSGKTTFTRWLCPPVLKDYLAENINTDKDSLIALTENFIIVLDELATLLKSEINALKSFFTKDQIKVRRPFDRRATTSKRRANFIGSTNKDEFLSDETGSVRWLCFKVESINFKYSLEVDINMVWSQAYSLYKRGFKCELTQDELKENELVNSEHQNSTPELELIQKHFKSLEKDKGGKFMTASDILRILNKEYLGLIMFNSIAIGKAISFLGIERVSIRHEGSKMPLKGYFLICNLPE